MAAARPAVEAGPRPLPPGPAAGLWEECRNNLGIARLLVSERRPQPLVATACRMAVETACRAALEQERLPWSGDVETALDRLRIHRVSADDDEAPSPRACLLAAEETVALVAARLRRQEPGRTWGL